ncbi:MAG TPA: Ig-like domain-containing protein, partial [Verrucomicrobiae bacterium]|nr:Ig-like domain-containing protein [Verrucomicrobiae bacterium]
MKYTRKKLILAVLATFIISLQPGMAATTNVLVGPGGGLRFSPTNVVISPGDSVIWQWVSGDHSTTSGTNGAHGDDNGVPSGLWDSGLSSSVGHTFTNTFTSSGIFSYYCSVHFSFGMTGQVIVASAAVPPAVAITNPAAGAVFAAPAAVRIQVAVTNGSTAVTNVQFLVNSAVLTNETTAPFSAVTDNLAAGNYTLTAIALDDNHLSATNSAVISVVTPVTTILSDPLESGGHFQFDYSANIGLNYAVQRSTNLLIWVTLTTNMAASNPIVFLDLNATGGVSFYRVG